MRLLTALPLVLFLISAQFTSPAFADGDMVEVKEMTARPGWSHRKTSKSYAQLIGDLKAAVKSHKFGVVTEAGPTEVSRGRGVRIPGNRVIGVFNNVYAVRVLELSTPAMIEAPIRFYVTENADGSADLSYKMPSTVFAPYLEEAGPELDVIGKELDATFASIARAASQ